MDVLELRRPADGRVQRVDLCGRWSSAEAHDSGTHAPTAAATQAVISTALPGVGGCNDEMLQSHFCIGSKQSSEQTHREVAVPIAVADRRCGQFFIDRGYITAYAPRLG